MTRPPWEYLFEPFNSDLFPDLFHPTWIASLVLLVGLIVLYNLRTRRLHRHPPYLDLWEWLLWSGLATFSLLIIGALFVFEFFIVLTTAIIGLSVMAWIRFRKFPPILAAYERKLAREQYTARGQGGRTTRTQRAAADATIRPKTARRSRRRR